MPIYEFECTHCGSVKEQFYRSIPKVEPSHTEGRCENCNVMVVHKKIMSTTSFQLKGAGWSKDSYGPQLVDGSPIVSLD